MANVTNHGAVLFLPSGSQVLLGVKGCSLDKGFVAYVLIDVISKGSNANL